MKKKTIDSVASNINVNLSNLKNKTEFIHYYETSSVDKGVFAEPEKLNVNKNKVPSRANKLAQNDDIVYSTVRPNLEHYGFIDFGASVNKSVFSTGFSILRPKENINPYYLYLLITQPIVTKHLNRIATTSTSSYPSILPEDILNMEIEMFEDKLHQEKIVSLIKNISEKIELNNKIISELESLTKLIYEYWFTQFDFPDENGKPYKSSGGKMVWNEKLKREIPEGWEVKGIEELIKFIKGFEPGSDNYSDIKKDGMIPFHRVGDLTNNDPVFVNKSNKVGKDQISKIGDILVSFDGSVGIVSINNEGIFSSGIQKAKPNKKYISNSLIYSIVTHDYFKKKLEKYATGSIIKHASNSKKFINIPINKIVFEQYNEITKDVFKKLIVLKKEIIELEKQRDFLLPLLMNGQVTIK